MTAFERLPESIVHGGLELGRLVHEQQPPMREADRTRSNQLAPPADDRGDRVAVVRGDVRRANAQRIVSMQQTCNRVDLTHFDRPRELQIREQSGHPLGKHRLAGAAGPSRKR